MLVHVPEKEGQETGREGGEEKAKVSGWRKKQKGLWSSCGGSFPRAGEGS